jgi:uncharacterized GH25 family protein
MRGFLAVASIALVGACVEYFYQHDIRGQVVDAAGEPVGGARVIRSSGADSSDVYGLANIYEQTTDESGAFAFVYSGSGGEPEPVSTWYLVVTTSDGRRTERTLQVQWRQHADAKQSGYLQQGVRLRLPAK